MTTAAAPTLAATERPQTTGRRKLVTTEPVLALFALSLFLANPACQQLIFDKYCERALQEAAAAAVANSSSSALIPTSCSNPDAVGGGGGGGSSSSSSDLVSPSPAPKANDSHAPQWRQQQDDQRRVQLQRQLYESVQADTSRMLLFVIIVVTLPQLATCAALGAWCDRGARKWPTVVPLAASALGYIGWSLLAWRRDLAAPLALIACFALGAGGFVGGVMMTAFGYLAAVAPADRRTLRFAVADGISSAAQLIGSLASGAAIERVGLTATLAVAATLNVLAVVYCVVWLDDHVDSDLGAGATAAAADGSVARLAKAESEAAGGSSLLRRRRSFYDMVSLRRACGSGVASGALLCTLAAFFAGYCSITGVGDLTYLYLTESIGFSPGEYGLFSGADVAAKLTAGAAALAALRRCLGVSDLAAAAAGAASAAAQQAALGAAAAATTAAARRCLAWASVLLGAPQFAFTVGIRSFVSKLADSNERGRAFGLLSAAQSAATLAGALLFDSVYPLTLDVFTGLSFVIASLLSVLSFTLLLAVACRSRRPSCFRFPRRRRSEYEVLPGVDCADASLSTTPVINVP